MVRWSPPCPVGELACNAYQLSRWQEPGTYQRAADRLDHLRIRLGASVSFDTDALTWTVVVGGMGDDPDEIVQSASITVLYDALDAIVTRRTAHLEESVRVALSALALYWAADYRVGYDKPNEECWAERLDGRGPRLAAPSPEALNKLMAGAVCCPPGAQGPHWPGTFGTSEGGTPWPAP